MLHANLREDSTNKYQQCEHYIKENTADTPNTTVLKSKIQTLLQ